MLMEALQILKKRMTSLYQWNDGSQEEDEEEAEQAHKRLTYSLNCSLEDPPDDHRYTTYYVDDELELRRWVRMVNNHLTLT